jgi:polynucleotide 5'-hydroxyl-kinase GRC3/NOL9
VCAVVVGPKGAGKSTLARLLLNTLQAATQRPVGLLDADCGAPELTPPGLVSLALLSRPLLGAPAARLGTAAAPRPLHSRFVGDTSPASDPAAYAAAVAALLRAWHAQPGGAAAAGSAQGAVPPAPLVINTLGWLRGMGLDLLAGLLRAAAPTHVLQLRPAGSGGGERSTGMPRGVFWAPAQAPPGVPPPPPCCVIELASPLAAGGEGAEAAAPARRSAADARTLLWAAWAHAASSAGGDETPAACDARWAALLSPDGAGEAAALSGVAAALAAARPFAVPFAALRCAALHAAVAPRDALRLLNGALVALVAPADASDASLDAAADAAAPRCLGLALVRSVDAAAGVLYLLTAVAPAEAARAVALAVGRLELPAALLAAPAHASPYLTPWALPPDGSGGAAMRSRNNLLRSNA